MRTSGELHQRARLMTAGIALFPFIIPSSLEPGMSLTMWDSTSSLRTLTVMTFAAIVFVPVILIYTRWCYYKMYGRITKEHIERNTHSLY
nr:Cytochrome d ubiquinol oxidase subunit 2 [Candidatus Pantoea persica]